LGRAGTPDRLPRPSAQSPAPTDPRDTDSVATSSAVVGANTAVPDYSRPGGNSPHRMGPAKPAGPSLVEGIQDRNRRELIMRAQERLQRRDSGPSHLAGAGGGAGGRGPSPSAESAFGGAQTARLSTFTRMSSQPEAGVFQGKDRERLMKENQRLTEEVAFLQKDNQRMRQGMVEGHSSEAQRLRTLLEESEAHRKESELGFARIRLQLEAQLKDSAEHEKALKEELRAYSVTLEQFESVCAEKDQQLNAERSTTHRLRQELKDKELEASRAISDALQQKEDFQIRLDRVSELLEDAKKQRTHLLELNDKFGRDKEAALTEKRRSAEELKTAQLELARQSERFADETAAGRREVERYKALLTEKERVLGLRIADEQRSREHYQKRHSEVEEQLSSIKTHHQEMVRTIQDEHRRQMDGAREEIAKANAKCRAAETEAELLQKRFDEKFDMERRQLVEEMNGLYAQLEKENKQLKDQLGAAQFTAQQAQEDRDAANAGYQRLRLEKAALEEKASGLEKELNRVTQTLESLLSSDDRVQQEREDLKRELEQSKLQISRMKDDVAMCAALEDQLQELSTENERLSEECGRLAKDRSELWSENHRLESELAQWRGEAQELRAVLKGRGTASARGYNAAPASDFTY
jgi:chromosome segregation ATPase